MKEIIKNTIVTASEVSSWRGEEVPLMDAKHNAQAAKLLGELDHIRNSEFTPDQKIAALIDIIIRGVQFRPHF